MRSCPLHAVPLALITACGAPAPSAPGGAPRGALPAGPPSDEAAWPGLLVNEVLAGNDSLLIDEAGDFDDWVELYNPTAEAVALDGWGLADDLGAPDWRFPPGHVIDPGAHLLVWLDGEPDEGELHAAIALDGDGEDLALFAPDDTRVDVLTWPALPDDVVWGRFPSGGAFVTSSIEATPLNANPVDPGLSLDPSDALFPKGEVIRVDLYIDPNAMETLEGNSDATVHAAVGFEGAFLPDVALSLKGGWGSFRDIDEKAGFRLNLDTFVPGQRLRGLENLTLNTMVQDDSGVHELLAYELFRDAGVPAPRVAHVELWMNNQYRGLYLNVETPDDQFLQRWFDDPDGNLYEGAYGQDVNTSSKHDLEFDELGPGQPDDRSDLDPLIRLLSEAPSEDLMPQFEALVDLDRSLPMLATEVVIAHWDGYFYYPNNWRIYHEPTTDQWTLLPWGVDQTFGSTDGIHDADGDIAEWCLDVPSCRMQYHLALWEAAERLASFDCETRIFDALDRIVPLYDADPFKEDDVAGMIDEAQDTADFCRDRPGEILSEIFPGGVP